MLKQGNWVLALAVVVLGLGALVLAGRAEDAALHFSALGIFAFSFLFVMMLVRQSFDQENEDR